jgi:hypothetical protein
MEPEEAKKLKDFPEELQDMLAKEMFKKARVTVIEQEVKDAKQKRRNLATRRRNYMNAMQTEAALLGLEEGWREDAEVLERREDALIQANVNQERMMQQMREQDVVIERKKQLFYYYEMNRRRVAAGRDIFE